MNPKPINILLGVYSLTESDAERIKNDFQELYNTEEGKRVLHQIIHWSGVYSRDDKINARTNALELAYKQGSRAVGQAVLEALATPIKDTKN